jgi:hypothetical protein
VIVVWGGNRMIDCVALLSWRNQTVLRLSTSPVVVDFVVPSDGSSDNGLRPLEIVANELVSPKPRPREVVIKSSPGAVAVLWSELPLIMAQDIGIDAPSGQPMVLLHTDLRPVGMNVFDDAAGIHVGGNVLARTAFDRCSTAIALR